jgi:hypothetical protein
MLSQDNLTLMMKALQSLKTLGGENESARARTHTHTHTQYHIPEDQILKGGNVSGDQCLEI